MPSCFRFYESIVDSRFVSSNISARQIGCKEAAIARELRTREKLALLINGMAEIVFPHINTRPVGIALYNGVDEYSYATRRNYTIYYTEASSETQKKLNTCRE